LVELVAVALLFTGLALWMLVSQRPWLPFSTESSPDPRAAQAAFAQESSIGVKVENEAGNPEVRVPPRTLGRTLRGLLKNAADASPASASIRLKYWLDSRFLYFQVSDQGGGMDEETLRRATEPFFTRKEPGKGLGLGLYLARTVAERFGGRLELQSEYGRGTTATLSVALDR